LNPPATSQIRPILQLLLEENRPFMGSTELREQAKTATVRGGSSFDIEIECSSAAAASSFVEGAIPNVGLALDATGEPLGELILWVREGRIDSLECAAFNYEFDFWAGIRDIEIRPLMQR
jgi:hypothetical protein